MKQFTLRLDATQQRPVVLLKNTLTALLDTGAYISVWTEEEDILTSVMGGKLIKRNVRPYAVSRNIGRNDWKKRRHQKIH